MPGLGLHQAFLVYFKFLLVINISLPSPFPTHLKVGSLVSRPKPPDYTQMCVRGKINDVNEREEWALD